VARAHSGDANHTAGDIAVRLESAARTPSDGRANDRDDECTRAGLCACPPAARSIPTRHTAVHGVCNRSQRRLGGLHRHVSNRSLTLRRTYASALLRHDDSPWLTTGHQSLRACSWRQKLPDSASSLSLILLTRDFDVATIPYAALAVYVTGLYLPIASGHSNAKTSPARERIHYQRRRYGGPTVHSSPSERRSAIHHAHASIACLRRRTVGGSCGFIGADKQRMVNDMQ
jgi:hypothetical protein